MTRFLVPLTVVAGLALASAGATSQETTDERPNWSPTQCPHTCVVVFNPGGLVNDFRRAALQLKAEGRTLMIDGDCISACTIAADVARPNVCITDRARFRFHKAFMHDAKDRYLRRQDLYEEYSSDIAGWVRGHGGFPGKSRGDQTLLNMDAQEAKAFFKRCEV